MRMIKALTAIAAMIFVVACSSNDQQQAATQRSTPRGHSADVVCGRLSTVGASPQLQAGFVNIAQAVGASS